MEKYYDKVSKKYYAGEKLEDSHPENFYQNGVTPEHIEKARKHCDRIKLLDNDNKPVSECPPITDSKWRFFWYIGERNKELDKDSIIYPNVYPEGFPQWGNIMDTWGNKMLEIVETASECIAKGFNLPENTFTDLMKYGGHLLAPTGSDLNKFKENEIFAGYHYDLNFLTIHGKSNYGGLYIWLRDGTKKRVIVPDGCLLIQAGIQLEYLTGGQIKAGFHEVIYPKDVYDKIQLLKEENEKKILWRISSTLFSQIRQDVILQPLKQFATEESIKLYPPILTKDQIAEELKAINLM
jgi:isopenicillin N synthase-like dioxygenase